MPLPSQRRQDLRQTIQTLEGLTPEDRSALLGLLAETKRYGLVWEDKPEDAHELLREQIPVFKEDASRRIVATTSRSLSDSPQGDCIEGPADDAPHHVLIEGDNLHALAALQYTHAGQVDVIYIDPPYNTGNKDFRYNDDYVDKEDAWRHSKWLSFMKKRLEIARILLKDCGVIFTSIGQDEYAQFKLLMDSIWGEFGCISEIARIATRRIKGDSENINRIHDYIFIYAKPGQFKIHHKDKEDYSIYTEEDEWIETRGRHLLRPLDNGTINYSAKSDYILESLEGVKIVAGGDFSLRDQRLSGMHGKKDWCFRWSKDKAEWGKKNGLIVFKNNENGKPRAYFKIYQFVDNDLKPSQKTDSYVSVLDGCYNNQGTSEIKKIIGVGSFTYPKPISLLIEILKMCGNESPIILDFFAGSGTTLHATMALNAEDGGKRQCILVTNNENKICEEVTYERNKRVIQGYTTPKGEQVAGLTANHLHYFKTEFVKREPTLKNRRQLMKLSVDLLRLKENAWDRIEAQCVKNELEAFQGKDFTLFVVLDTDAIPTVIGHIKAQSGKAKVYVFSPGAYAWDEEFEDVRERIDLCAVPEAIYRALEPHLPAVKRIADEVAA